MSLQSRELHWGGGSQQPCGGILGFQSPGILGLKSKTGRLEEQSRAGVGFRAPCKEQVLTDGLGSIFQRTGPRAINNPSTVIASRASRPGSGPGAATGPFRLSSPPCQ